MPTIIRNSCRRPSEELNVENCIRIAGKLAKLYATFLYQAVKTLLLKSCLTTKSHSSEGRLFASLIGHGQAGAVTRQRGCQGRGRGGEVEGPSLRANL